MATYKKLNGTYTIDTTEVIIVGNLTVTGTQAAIQTTNTEVTDKIIALNVGEAGAGVGPAGGGTSGIEIDRGSLANVTLRWNEAIDTWQFTSDGSSYANIGIAGPPGANLSLVDDPNPTMSANLKTNGFVFTSNIADNIKFQGNLQINYTAVLPSAVGNTVVLYSNVPSGGTTGLYIVNSEVTNEELITKKRAFGYSMIL